MPNKNNKNKPNGFVLYANEIRDDLLRNGHVIRSMPDLIAAASPKWQILPNEEKEYYKDRAKWEWENRTSLKTNSVAEKPLRPSRKDCTGLTIDNREDIVQVDEERRRRERIEVFLSWPTGRAVMDKNFYFISFISLLEDPEYQPIEVAAVEFNLLRGVVRDWHKYINPGPIERGYHYLVQRISEETHKIPIEGISTPGDTYTSIYDELLQFISRGTTHIPPLHVKLSECDKVEGCIKWLSRMAGRPHQIKRIYELEGLILDLDFHLKGQPQDFLQSKGTATNLISSTVFDWDSGIKCSYHEENETIHCASSKVFKYSYLVADYFCDKFQIPLGEGHQPVKAEKCYTLIKSEKERIKEKKLARAGNVDEIARIVTEKLNFGDHMRSTDGTESSVHFLDEESKMEEKKRWLSLRGTLSVQESESVCSGSNSQLSSSVFGRGRGRGKGDTSQTLRQPGRKMDPSAAKNDVQRGAFGRGTKMYTGS